MAKPFEIVYGPDQWSAPPGGTPTAWGAPYGGLHTMAPENMIGPHHAPALSNVFFRNNELRSRPRFIQKFAAPQNNTTPIQGVVTVEIGPTQKFTYVWQGNHVYLLGVGGAWTDLGATSIDNGLMAYITAGGIVYFTSNSSATNAITGPSTVVSNIAYLGANNPPLANDTRFGAQFIAELGNHILLINTIETSTNGASNTIFPNRIRWSNVSFNMGLTGANLGTIGATFDPAINLTAGVTDLLDVGDTIRAVMSVGRVLYLLRTNGITEVSPTGNAQVPFDFNHLWTSQRGIGNAFLGSQAQYGNICVFAAQDDVYLMSFGGGINTIGGGARDSILADLIAATAPPQATILPWYTQSTPYFVYELRIPQGANTICYVYELAANNWTKWLITGSVPTAPTYSAFVPSSMGFSLSPSANGNTGIAFLGFHDCSNYNDATDSSSYSYRQEEPLALYNRVPTVRRVILQYRDIGVCTLTVTVSGVDDNGAAQSASQVITIGNASPTNRILTKFVDIVLSAFRPQVSFSRAANGGPFSIVRTTVVGEVEEVTF